MATIPNRLPDRRQPCRRSGVRGHPQPIGHAQPFAQDVPRVIAGVGIPVHQQRHHRRPVNPQPRRQVGGQVRRAMPQPARVGRVRGQFDPRQPKGQQQRGEFVGVRVHSSPQPSPVFVGLATVATVTEPTRIPAFTGVSSPSPVSPRRDASRTRSVGRPPLGPWSL